METEEGAAWLGVQPRAQFSSRPALAIVQDDQVVFAGGFGVRELNKPEPVTERSLFMIASNTKAFTAAAAAILVHRKQLSWDDRAQTRLPWYQVFDGPWISHEVRLDAQFLLNADSKPDEFRLDVPNEDFWFDELEFKRK